ncbi:MAG TPA: pitrilysin family protein [Candidatus Acidoferrales bacterium]|nr:pitrilysin family protein [Candidatus Acidoferrales bacterium]HEV2340515.1 pitrilysin family protein [Candidatus Acidoferrales bacterium]
MNRPNLKNILNVFPFCAAILSLALFATLTFPVQAQDQSAQQSVASSDQKPSGVVPPGVKLVPQMPEIHPPRPFHFPDAATRTLPNGLRIFVVADHRQPSVAVSLVMMSAGTIHDPSRMPGIAQMTAAMLTQGTPTHSAQQFAQAIDSVGGSISASADDDATSADLSIVASDADFGMQLLSDAVLHPAFSDQELGRQRQQALSGLQVEYSDAGYLASAVFDRAVYGASPYGLPGEGTPDSVKKIQRDDLVKFHDSSYAPNAALLAFAGDITPERAFALAEKYFGSWEKKGLPAEEAAAPAPLSGLHFFIVDKPDAVQTQIRVGKLGIRRDSPDYLPLLVTNRIFGGGFNSRLNTEVRVKKGLTYGAFSGFNANRFAGSLDAGTSTRTEATVEATKLIVDLIAKMSTGDVTPAELKFAQEYLSGVYPIQSETAAQVAGRILTVAKYGLPADYNDTYQQNILGVDEASVRGMASRYFNPQDLDIVLVGNAAKFLDALRADYPNAKWDEIPLAQLDLLSPDLHKPAAAVPAASPESLARGHEILLAAAQAAGGAALSSLKGAEIIEKGNIYTPQGPLAITVKWQVQYPDKVHSEIGTPMGQMVQVADGKSAWIESPRGTAEVPASAVGEFERGILLFGGWGLYQQALFGTVRTQYVGQEDMDGKKADAVNWLASFGTIKLYFDSATHLLIAAKFQSTGMQGTEDSDEHWNDFRTVEGLQFPYQSVLNRSGQKFTDSTVQEVRLNPALDPALFTKPGSSEPPKQP